MRIYCRLGGVEVTERVLTECIWEWCGCCPPGLGGGSCRVSPQQGCLLCGCCAWESLCFRASRKGPVPLQLWLNPLLLQMFCFSFFLLHMLLCLLSSSLNLPFSGFSQTMREAPGETMPCCIYLNFSAVSSVCIILPTKPMISHYLD